MQSQPPLPNKVLNKCLLAVNTVAEGIKRFVKQERLQLEMQRFSVET